MKKPISGKRLIELGFKPNGVYYIWETQRAISIEVNTRGVFLTDWDGMYQQIYPNDEEELMFLTSMFFPH